MRGFPILVAQARRLDVEAALAASRALQFVRWQLLELSLVHLSRGGDGPARICLNTHV